MRQDGWERSETQTRKQTFTFTWGFYRGKKYSQHVSVSWALVTLLIFAIPFVSVSVLQWNQQKQNQHTRKKIFILRNCLVQL